MKQFNDLLAHIIDNGRVKEDRTNTGTYSVFGYQNSYDLLDGFPLLGLKKTFTRGIFAELLWFIKGDTNIKYLVDNKVNIWNEWAYERYLKHASSLKTKDLNFHKEDAENGSYEPYSQVEFVDKIKSLPSDNDWVLKWGDLGPVYGKQWTNWVGVKNGAVNQLDNVINGLINNPDSRRHIVNSWNIDDLPDMALSPCHCMFQFNVVDVNEEDIEKALKQGYDLDSMPSKKLDCQLYQRSADVFLGVPFNIASYALLTHMIAQVTNMLPGTFIHTFGDAHIYSNHKAEVNSYLNRTRKGEEEIDFFDESIIASNSLGSYEGPKLPMLELNKEVTSIHEFKLEDIRVLNYKPLSAIKAPIAV